MLKGMKIPARYTAPAMGFHWLMAVLIISMLGIGLYMVDMPNTLAKFQLIQLHKSIGLTILMLAAARLMWRFTHPAPLLPAHMAAWQKSLAHASHYLLYILMFAMPLSGWVMSDAAGYHPAWFGLPVPHLSGANPSSAKLFGLAHNIGAYIFIALLTLHVAAALLHHFWYRDPVLLRMLPRGIAKHIPQPTLINKG